LLSDHLKTSAIVCHRTVIFSLKEDMSAASPDQLGTHSATPDQVAGLW